MRKKIFPIFLLAAAACFAVSCEKEDSLSENPTNPNNQRLSKFSGSIEQLASDSKTHLGQNDVVLWDNNDPIVINGHDYQAAPDETDATKAKFRTGEASDVDPDANGYYTAYYPASIYNNGGTPTLPAVQQYTANHIDNLPMYAKSNTTFLQFHNICGVMELNLKGSTKSVMAISVTAMDDNTALNGPFSVEDNKAVIPSCSQASQRTVTLDCGSTGVALNNSNPTKFWIALPAFQDKQLLLTIRATDGTCLWKKTLNNVTLAANSIQEINLTLDYNAFEKMSGYFQGADNRILQFACGNLKKESGTYIFFPNQIGGYVNNKVPTKRKYVDLFTYETLDSLTEGSFHLNLPYPTISGDNTWEVLSKEDWESVIGTTRPGSTVNSSADCRFARVKINGDLYLLLCPDNAVITGAADISYWNSKSSLAINVFTELSDDQCQVYEKAGCVFLPAAGYYNGTTFDVSTTGSVGYYWSSNPDGSTNAYYFRFYASGVNTNGHLKNYFRSVRLAQTF